MPAAARLPSTLLPLHSPTITSLVLTHCRSNQAAACGLASCLFNSVCGKGSPLFAGWGRTWPGNQPALGAHCPVVCCQTTSSLRLAAHRGRKASTAAIVAPCSDLCALLSTFPPVAGVGVSQVCSAAQLKGTPGSVRTSGGSLLPVEQVDVSEVPPAPNMAKSTSS